MRRWHGYALASLVGIACGVAVAYARGHTEPVDWAMARVLPPPTAEVVAEHGSAPGAAVPPAATATVTVRPAPTTTRVPTTTQPAEVAAAIDRAERVAAMALVTNADLHAAEAIIADAEALAAEARDRSDHESALALSHAADEVRLAAQRGLADLKARRAAVALAEAESMAAAASAAAQEDAQDALNRAREADAVREALAEFGVYRPVAIRAEDLGGLSHPDVQAQARAAVESVVAAHEQQWPWLRTAYEAAPWLFWDHAAALPCGRKADGCIRWWTDRPSGPKTGIVIATHLDAVKDDRLDELVVHELAHEWEHTTNEGADMAAAFAVHYVGCYAEQFDAEALASELLADAVVMLVLQVGYLEGSWPPPEDPVELFDWSMQQHREPKPYGHYNLDFEGCLVDKRPTEELWGLLREMLG